MNDASNMKELADKDKINFIAAFFHHIDIVFSILSLIAFFENGLDSIIGVALTLFILERVFQFIYTGIKTFKWQQSLLSLIYLDYFSQMLRREEGRGLQLFKKKQIRVYTISSPFALFCFYTFFESNQDQALALVCGLIHLLNTAHTNQEYYTQNILTIGAKQKNYIFLFLVCEFFYRLVFLSYFKNMIGEAGIISYMITEFIIYYLLEFIVCKKEGQVKSYWIISTLQKAWGSVFYYRFEDTIVHDVDEWNSESRCIDNYRQKERESNNFKSFRSKLYIILRFLENMLLTLLGILEFSRTKQFSGLFALAIILLPFYLLWHAKYYRVNYRNQQNSNNNSIAADAVQQYGNKFKTDKQTINQAGQLTPISDKYNQKINFNDYQMEKIYGSNQKKLKSEENREQNTCDTTAPDSQDGKRTTSNNNYLQNLDIETGQFNSNQKQSNNLEKQPNNIQNQQSNSSKQQQNSQRSRRLSRQSSKQYKFETKKTKKLDDEQDYDDDDPYGHPDVNAFSIE